jgi:RNA recognition motif. (a.k.a. RRM, RBD, or RNP domain)
MLPSILIWSTTRYCLHCSSFVCPWARAPGKSWLQALIVAAYMAVSFRLCAVAYTSPSLLCHGLRSPYRQAKHSHFHNRFAFSVPRRRICTYQGWSLWKNPQSSTFILPYHPRMLTSTASDVSASGSSTQLDALMHREPDWVETLIGGERYSLVPMPDRMKATTLFVGNLCEFVRDADLSNLFSQVSSLMTVPSCVVRKVDTQSMGYGFVSFPSVKEKEVSPYLFLLAITYFFKKQCINSFCLILIGRHPSISQF